MYISPLEKNMKIVSTRKIKNLIILYFLCFHIWNIEGRSAVFDLQI